MINISRPRQRLPWVDNLKAFLIYLVVLGHCIQYTCGAYKDDILFYIIYTFHMPLFMLISGFVSYRSEMKWNVVSRRFFQLMIPFFVYTFGAALIKWDVQIFVNTILYPERGLWFLWVLFFIIFFQYIGRRISEKIHCPIIVMDIVVLLMLFIVGRYVPILGVATTAKFYLYYCAGQYLRKYERLIFTGGRVKGLFILSAFAWFILVFVGFKYKNLPIFSNNILFDMAAAFTGTMAFILLFFFYFTKYNEIMSKVGGGYFRNIRYTLVSAVDYWYYPCQIR